VDQEKIRSLGHFPLLESLLWVPFSALMLLPLLLLRQQSSSLACKTCSSNTTKVVYWEPSPMWSNSEKWEKTRPECFMFVYLGSRFGCQYHSYWWCSNHINKIPCTVLIMRSWARSETRIGYLHWLSTKSHWHHDGTGNCSKIIIVLIFCITPSLTCHLLACVKIAARQQATTWQSLSTKGRWFSLLAV